MANKHWNLTVETKNKETNVCGQSIATRITSLRVD